MRCFPQRDLLLQLWGSNMKLFDQGIQLLFPKSKISVQKERINIFNYYYSLKSQNFFQYLNIQEQRLYFFPVSQTLFGQALSSLICCVRVKFRFWAYQFPSCVTSLNPVPYQRILLQNFVEKNASWVARTPVPQSVFVRSMRIWLVSVLVWTDWGGAKSLGNDYCQCFC